MSGVLLSHCFFSFSKYIARVIRKQVSAMLTSTTYIWNTHTYLSLCREDLATARRGRAPSLADRSGVGIYAIQFMGAPLIGDHYVANM